MTRGTPAHHPFVRALARRYTRRRLGREFDGLYVHGLNHARALVQREPVIVAATHVCWWDALVALELDALLAGQGYCLMDAENLAQHAYFALVGAIPLRRGPLKHSLSDMRAAAALLDRPGRTLWIFPQGRQRPSHLRPFGLQPGVSWLSRASGARILPLAFAYVYREAPKPAIVASFGEPIEAGCKSALHTLEERFATALGRVDQFLEGEDAQFEPALLPGPSKRGIPLLGRLLGRMLRGRAWTRLSAGKALH